MMLRHIKFYNLGGRFVEQKFMLSSSFRCDKIHKCQIYDLGHTVMLLKSGLGVQQTHPWFYNRYISSEVVLFNIQV
jgi:hypothetical protein